MFATEESYLVHVPGATPDVRELIKSFRTKAYGMLSGLVMLNKLVKDNRCSVSSSGTILVNSDSESLIKSICKYKQFNMTIKAYYGPDIDVIAQIFALIQQLALQNIYTVFEHVRGHQDGAPIPTPLSLPAVLNIEAD